jgi:hypothetical protein
MQGTVYTMNVYRKQNSIKYAVYFFKLLFLFNELVFKKINDFWNNNCIYQEYFWNKWEIKQIDMATRVESLPRINCDTWCSWDLMIYEGLGTELKYTR